MDPDANAPSSYSATTDFESMSHEDMVAMIEGANAEHVTSLGQKLNNAEKVLNEIGGELKTNMGKLDWDGDGGDAFRAWGHKVAIATESLADYSGTVGRFMEHAGTVLGDVKKAMPPVPEQSKAIAKAYSPGKSEEESMAELGFCPTPEAVKNAKQEVTDARDEAARQMIKLGQAYNMSTDIIADLKEPEFPPPPTEVMPTQDTRGGVEEFGTYTGSDGSGAYAGKHTSAGHLPGETSSTDTGHVSPVQPEARDIPSDVDVIDDRATPLPPITTEIDSVTTLPPPTRETLPPTTPVPVGDGVGKLTIPPTGPTIVPPVTTGPPRSIAGTPPPRVTPRVPTVGRVGGTDGIYGGRQLPHTGPVNQLPKAPVVGTERGVASARPPIGYGGGPISGGTAPAPLAGRRLASEPGGVVGGARRTGPVGAAPFTPGGAGLVRRGAQKPDEERREQSERPDYLVEDEETWAVGDRNVAPPVID